VRACQRNGIAVNQAVAKTINVKEEEPKYSSRQILTV